KSASQWDPKKLNWVNAHYIKQTPNTELARLVAPRVKDLGGDPNQADLAAVMELLKDRAETLNELAEGALLFCAPFSPAEPELQQQFLDDGALQLLEDFASQAATLPEWNAEALDGLVKSLLSVHGVKMPKLGIPLRLAVTGKKQTPSITHVLAI